MGQSQKSDQKSDQKEALDNKRLKEKSMVAEREKWQKEFVARQAMVEQQMAHRKEMRKVPKVAKAFILLWGGVLACSVILFMMSFHPSTKELVSKILGSFKVF